LLIAKKLVEMCCLRKSRFKFTACLVQNMQTKAKFTRKFFEAEYPRLLKLTDSEGNQPDIIMMLPEGNRLDLREFQVTEKGILMRVSSDRYLISYDSILSIQVIPRSLKRMSGRCLKTHKQGSLSLRANC